MICASDVTDDVDQSNCLVCLFPCVAASGEGLACFSYRGFDIEDGVHFAPAICNLEGTIESISGSFQYMTDFTKPLARGVCQDVSRSGLSLSNVGTLIDH